jgi:hypothetical protein
VALLQVIRDWPMGTQDLIGTKRWSIETVISQNRFEQSPLAEVKRSNDRNPSKCLASTRVTIKIIDFSVNMLSACRIADRHSKSSPWPIWRIDAA